MRECGLRDFYSIVHSPCSLLPVFMKLALAILALVVFALSFAADYKWRQWMAKRRADHDQTPSSTPDHRREPR